MGEGRTCFVSQLFGLGLQNIDKMSWSAYEVKNNSCLFERLFKVKKNGVFLFGISFLVLEIFTFFYYAHEESDDVIDGSTKTAQHSIENNSKNIKAVFFKLGTRNVHHKRNRMTPTMLLPCKHSWLQSLSVKNQVSPFATF